MHAFGYAAQIGVREVLIPLGNGASTLSAYGIAAGDVTRFAESETSLRAPFDDAALFRELSRAISRARQSMAAAGVAGEPQLDAWALMRYQEQLMHSLDVLIDPADTGADRLVSRFTDEYARRYGPSAASAFQAAGVFALRGRARLPAALGAVTAATPSGPGAAGPTAQVFWPVAGQRLGTAVYDGDQLADGAEISGPALVELSHTTIAVPRGASLTADRGHFRLRLPAAPTAAKGVSLS